MPDIDLIRSLYTDINTNHLKESMRRQLEFDEQEYFDAKVLGRDAQDGSWTVRVNGGNVKTQLTGNTTPKIGEVVALYYPRDTVRGQIITKPRS